MATISRLLCLRHLRSDPTSHIVHFRGGKKVRGGRGLSFWFVPLSASLAEIPCDDRDQPFLFHGRSRDFQDVTVQGTITYRVVDPERLAERIDFTIDSNSGAFTKAPLEQLSELLTQVAQQLAWSHMNKTPLRELLESGVDELRERIRLGLDKDANRDSLGMEIVSIRVAGLSPTSELEKALQAPTRESIQEASDEAVFRRRALAVEKERAIADNELQNRIELARREEELIAQHGQNRRHKVQETAEAKRIEVDAEVARRRIRAAARAESIEVVEAARIRGESQQMEIYRDLPTQVMWGLAARQLAGTLQRIDHLNLAGDSLGPLLTNLLQAGVRQLEED